MTPDQIRQQIAMLLRDHPLGTTADLLDYTVAFWDGRAVHRLYLTADEPGFDDELGEFELTDEFIENVATAIEDWLVSPRYTFRPELLEWLKDAPPFDAGT